ncbi:MAG: nucleotide exchange factor GrpE [Anaerolineae bacterium]|nr:nucleotide exchange factor GrpE [Anaerolineae bacterium]
MAEDAKPNEMQRETEAQETPQAAEPAPVSTPEEDEKESLRQALEKAQAEAKDYLDQLLRSRADYANYKRRVEQEKQELIRYGNANLIAQLLPVLDDFERAFLTVPSGLDKLTWVEGIALVHRKLQLILEKEGLKPIQANGQKFNPMEHEAIAYEERADVEDGTILAEVQKGYKLGDRVLRPTLVRVAKQVPAAAPAAEEQAGAQTPSEEPPAESKQDAQ